MMRTSEADMLTNAVKTLVLFSPKTNMSFLLKVQNKMNPRTRQNQQKGAAGLQGMELFSLTSLSIVLKDVEPNNGKKSIHAESKGIWFEFLGINLFTIPVL